jgi:hypothetical protein
MNSPNKVFLRLCCACGAAFESDVHVSVVERFSRAFWSIHNGPGHGPGDERDPVSVAEALVAGVLRSGLV